MPCLMRWSFKSGLSYHLSHENYETCESLIHEWVMFRRKKDPSRRMSRDPMIGGKGWAFDMRQLAAMQIIDPPPPLPPIPPTPPVGKLKSNPKPPPKAKKRK